MPPHAGQQLELMEGILFQSPSSSLTTTSHKMTIVPFTTMTMSQQDEQQKQISSRRRQRQRRVCFTTDEPTIYEIPNMKHELTIDELQQIYLSRHDLRRIKRENSQTLQLMNDGAILVDTNDNCYRGLECHMPIAKRDRYQRVTNVLQAVLDEQDNNNNVSYNSSSRRGRGSSPPEGKSVQQTLSSHWIHTCYSNLTTRSEEIAIMMGLIDEDAARDYYDATTTTDDYNNNDEDVRGIAVAA